MTVLKADSDGAEPLGNRLCGTINFVEGRSSPRQGAGDFVDKNCAGKATGSRRTSILQKETARRTLTHRLPTMLP